MNRTPETSEEKIQKIEDAFSDALQEHHPNGVVNVYPVPKNDKYVIELLANVLGEKIGRVELDGWEWDMAKDKRELARTKVRDLL